MMGLSFMMVQKVGIKVDDAPFVAVNFEIAEVEGQQMLVFETNVGDKVVADSEHPIRVEYNEQNEPSPYVMVRSGLEALISSTCLQ